MSDAPSSSMRTHVAVAIAAATTTLALGLTLTLFGGHVGRPPTPAPASSPESASPAADPVRARAPDAPVVLVPVERLEPELAPELASAASDDPFVFDDDGEHGFRREREHDEHRRHEEHDDDD